MPGMSGRASNTLFVRVQTCDEGKYQGNDDSFVLAGATAYRYSRYKFALVGRAKDGLGFGQVNPCG